MNTAPQKITETNTLFAGILLAATLLGSATMVFFFNPATHSFYPVCQFHRLTGLNCPGCGMTRALYALLHGNFSVALHDNALFVLLLGAMAIRGAWFWCNKFKGRKVGKFFPTKLLWPLLAIVAGFTVLRNLALFSFMSP